MADREERPFAGQQLYLVTVTAWRRLTGGTATAAHGEIRHARSADEAEEKMVGDYSERWPVSEGWELRTKALELNPHLILEFGLEYARRRSEGLPPFTPPPQEGPPDEP